MLDSSDYSTDKATSGPITEELTTAAASLQRAVQEGRLRAAALCVRRDREVLCQAGFGEASNLDSIFLIASITKPLTAAAIMLLADRKELTLQDPVVRFIPEFHRGERCNITVRHLLTHTSGLPDQLPHSVQLRQRQAPLAEFVRETIHTPLLFRPGTRCRYQSMGYLLAAEIVERLTGKPLRDFFKAEIFEPLGMTCSSLGLGRLQVSDTMQCQVESSPGDFGGGPGSDAWNWNSRYWRDLGAPWGGAHSTVSDLARLLEYFLWPDGNWMREESAAAMIENQNQGLNRPWGIGFSVDPRHFGHDCSRRIFGHWGATGTLAWADPDSGSVCVLLTTLPWEASGKLLSRVSRETAAALYRLWHH